MVTRRRLTRALAIGLATLAALAVWIVGEPVLGHDLVVTMSGQEPKDLGAAEVVMLSLVASALGWSLLAVLERVAPARAVRIWLIASIVALALSFVPFVIGHPFGIEATPGGKVTLAVMHLAVAAVLIPMLIATTRPSADEGREE